MASKTFKSHCYASGCPALIRYGLLMCLPHWNAVSHETQQMVYKTCREWNKGGSVQPYLKARDEANFEATGVRKGYPQT